jgi:hypothetical protein
LNRRLVDLAQSQRLCSTLEPRDVAVCEARLASIDSHGRVTATTFAEGAVVRPHHGLVCGQDRAIDPADSDRVGLHLL